MSPCKHLARSNLKVFSRHWLYFCCCRSNLVAYVELTCRITHRSYSTSSLQLVHIPMAQARGCANRSGTTKEHATRKISTLRCLLAKTGKSKGKNVLEVNAVSSCSLHKTTGWKMKVKRSREQRGAVYNCRYNSSKVN